jgi:DNA-binding transcriptional LysR family regulator
MELRHLRYFVAIAEELSFSGAARRLHIAQPPLSLQIKQLEEELGARLFERTSRKVRLTSAGELFLARATGILREAALAVLEVERAGRGELGSLRLSFSGTTLTYDPLLPEILRGYRAAHPDIHLTLHEQRSREQINDLLAGRMDAGFLGLSRADTASDSIGKLAVQVLLREALFVVLPDNHPLAKRRQVTLCQIREEPLVWTGRMGVYLSEDGFDLRGGSEVNSMATVLNYVAAGYGISILPEQYTNFAVSGISFVPYASAPPFCFGMAWRRGTERIEPLFSFLEHAREVSGQRQRR